MHALLTLTSYPVFPLVYHVIFISCAVRGRRGFKLFYLPYFEKWHFIRHSNFTKFLCHQKMNYFVTCNKEFLSHGCFFLTLYWPLLIQTTQWLHYVSTKWTEIAVCVHEKEREWFCPCFLFHVNYDCEIAIKLLYILFCVMSTSFFS